MSTPTRVLVWQTYGQIRVFLADTPLQYFKIHDELKFQMTGWGYDEELQVLFERMGGATTKERCERFFRDFAQKHVGTHETFETFEFTDIQDLTTRK